MKNSGIKRKISSATAGMDNLNKKALELRRSWKEVSDILNSGSNKDSKDNNKDSDMKKN